MTGDDRTRHCARCDRVVHDVSAMTAGELRELTTSGTPWCGRVRLARATARAAVGVGVSLALVSAGCGYICVPHHHDSTPAAAAPAVAPAAAPEPDPAPAVPAFDPRAFDIVDDDPALDMMGEIDTSIDEPLTDGDPAKP